MYATRVTVFGALAASLLVLGTASSAQSGHLFKVGPWAVAESDDNCSMAIFYNEGSLSVTYDTKNDVSLDITTDKIKLKEGEYSYTLLFTDQDGDIKASYPDTPLYADPPNEQGRTFLKGLFHTEVLDAIKISDALAMMRGEDIVAAFPLPNAPAAIGKFKGCIEHVRKVQGSSRK